jgi:ABC-2 type transport system permease protein
MALSGTDFYSYIRFQQQAENYRYGLAQHMNDLQIKLISNKKTDGPQNISSEYWKAFPDFTFRHNTIAEIVRGEALSVVALMFWMALLIGLISFLSGKLKVV